MKPKPGTFDTKPKDAPPHSSSPAVAMAWYAVQTKPRHEKVAAAQLKAKGLHTFLPLIARSRVSRGRRIDVEVPLFAGYLFINSDIHRLQDAGWTRGVLRILGDGRGAYSPVPDEEINGVQAALDADLRLDPHPYLKEGQRVRVKYGPLAGVEGILISKDRRHRLIISVDLIARSASLAINADDVEPL